MAAKYTIALLLSSLFTFASEVKPLPNVITIITDDQGWGDIGYNNPDKVYTPNLDALAQNGALCTNNYSMPQCTPSRIAAFTGRYPGRFGNEGLAASMGKVFPIGTYNLALFLKEHGYKTYLSGKWHLGASQKNGPHQHGFDSSYGSFSGAVGYYDHRYRLNTPKENTWHRDGQLIAGHENGVHVTDLVSNEAIRVINKHESDESPFYLYLAYHAPHTPLDERGEFIDTPTQLDPANPSRWLNEDNIKWFHDPKGIIQSEKDPEKRLFLAVLHHLDDSIGQVLKTLDATGQTKDTIILFSSDNGPQVNWKGNSYPNDLKLTDFNQPIPFRGKKTDTYEGGINVPGFVYWKGTIPAHVIDTPVHIVDWMKTIGGFIGKDPAPPSEQPSIDGQDNSKLFLSSSEPTTRPIYQIWGSNTSKWALSYGEWKIIKYGKGEPKLSEWELYNLDNDKKEEENLALKHPQILEKLHHLFLTERAKDLQ